MQRFKFIAVAVLVWGNSALANLPPAGDNVLDRRDQVLSWMAQLNAADPTLLLAPRFPLNDAATINETASDVQALYSFLKYGQPVIHDGGLITLSCQRALCFSHSSSNVPAVAAPVQTACPIAVCKGHDT